MSTERAPPERPSGRGPDPIARATGADGPPGGDRPVSAADLERELRAVSAAAAGPVAGVFGPASATWRVGRESSVFLGAGAAMLLQLAHPWVAAAIARHSRAVDDPIGRFHRTFGVVHAMVFGSLPQALAAARRLHARHASVGGALAGAIGPFAAGSAYLANEVAALRWVHATLVGTALEVHEAVHSPLEPTERERYWAESRLMAGLFGVPGDALPASWDGFAAYLDATGRSPALAVGPEARAVAEGLLRRRGLRPGAPAWYDAVTASLLPEPVRDGFGLPFGPAQRAAADRALARARALVPRLPARFRFVGPYHEALARLEGRAAPDLGVRLANHLWIGRGTLGG